MVANMIETSTDALFAAFPHLRKVELLWGSPECRTFLFNLMTDTRGGTRQGFPKEHAATLMALLLEHDRRFPQYEHCVTFEAQQTWGPDLHRRSGRH